MMPSLIIFDCDGVLVDSEVIACRTDAEELTRVGFTITLDEVIARFTGVTGKEMYATLEAEHGLALPAGFEDHVEGLVDAALETELRAIDGVDDLLQSLDLAVCVASASRPEALARKLRLTALYDYFAPHIFSAQMVARGKPAPDIFLHAAARMAAAPADCVVIEDSVAGVQAGVAAGMPVLGFTGGGHTRPGHGERLRAAGAEQTFDAMAALADLVAGRGAVR